MGYIGISLGYVGERLLLGISIGLQLVLVLTIELSKLLLLPKISLLEGFQLLISGIRLGIY